MSDQSVFPGSINQLDMDDTKSPAKELNLKEWVKLSYEKNLKFINMGCGVLTIDPNLKMFFKRESDDKILIDNFLMKDTVKPEVKGDPGWEFSVIGREENFKVNFVDVDETQRPNKFMSSLCKEKPFQQRQPPNIQSGSFQQKRPANFPTGSSQQKRPENFPAGPFQQKRPANFPAGSSQQKRPANFPAGSSQQKRLANFPAESFQQKQPANFPAGSSQQKRPANFPAKLSQKPVNISTPGCGLCGEAFLKKKKKKDRETKKMVHLTCWEERNCHFCEFAASKLPSVDCTCGHQVHRTCLSQATDQVGGLYIHKEKEAKERGKMNQLVVGDIMDIMADSVYRVRM